MPNKLIDKVVETCNISREKAEELWSQAEEIAKKQYHLGTSLSGKDYALVVGIFKNSITKSCCQKLGWVHEGQMEHIHKLILESKKKKEEEDEKKKNKKKKEEEDEKKKNKKKKVSKDDIGTDEEELKKDAAETTAADKSNEFPTEENKLIRSVFSLIEEVKIGKNIEINYNPQSPKQIITNLKNSWKNNDANIKTNFKRAAIGIGSLYAAKKVYDKIKNTDTYNDIIKEPVVDIYKDMTNKSDSHKLVKTAIGAGALGAGAYGIKKLRDRKQNKNRMEPT